MKLSDFDYSLPEELIASVPLPQRTASRLLALKRDNGEIQHRNFADLLELLRPDDLLVLNNTKVIPARLPAKKITGGKVEILIERVLDQRRVLAMAKGSKSLAVGSRLFLPTEKIVEVIAKHGQFLELLFLNAANALELIERLGAMPLPLYIKRQADAFDRERYQTVYAKHLGAVAAPTAGLHFDRELLSALAGKGIKQAYVTLHVGAGTFQPVRVENIVEHKMHAEYVEVSQPVCDLIEETKQRGGRVIAVGTTSVRALETAAMNGSRIARCRDDKGELIACVRDDNEKICKPYYGDTNIFIYPGYQFQCIDALITNFHLPKSTLLMLVCAFAGFKQTMTAYQAAIDEKYRFYSYGDAMYIY